MKIELFKEVALTKDFPEYKLRTGDVGTVVEQLSYSNSNGYAVEFLMQSVKQLPLLLLMRSMLNY